MYDVAYLFFRRHYRSSDNIFSRSEYSQWLEDIENTFRDLNSAYADWRRRHQTPGRLAIFNMMVPDEPQPASKAQLPESLYCQWPEETTMFETAFSRELNQKVVLDSVPKMLDGIEYPFSEKAYVLPASWCGSYVCIC